MFIPSRQQKEARTFRDEAMWQGKVRAEKLALASDGLYFYNEIKGKVICLE